MAMTDAEICNTIDDYSEQSIGVDDAASTDRDTAMAYYQGLAEGDLAPPEVPGRSRVVSRDVLEAVEWAMPALVKMFTARDDIIRFEPDGPEDEQACDDATNYVGYLIHRKNEDGFVTMHDAIKSALIVDVGCGKTYVSDSQERRVERYEGLTTAQVEMLRDDKELEIEEEEPDGFALPEGGAAPEPTFRVRAARTQKVKQFRNEGIPYDELRVHKDTRVISDCKFIEHRREVTLSYLREQGYDEAKIGQLADGNDTNKDGTPTATGEPDDSQRLVWLSDAYLRLDIEGTGKTKYWRVIKAGAVIFEREETDDHPYWWFTPILMPNQIRGMGFYDLLCDLQRIQTALKRGVLDNSYLMNNPRTEAVLADILNVDELLSPRVGGIVGVKNINSTREIVVQPLMGPGLELIRAFDQVRDTRSGVTEMNSAMSGESLSQTNVGSQGVQALMQAGAQRLELMARVMAETGFRRMYYLMLKNVTQHQDRPQQMRINGRWLTVDPREWRNKYNMTVSVGTGTSGRQENVANLRAMGQMLMQLMPMGLAKPENFREIAKRTIENMGFKDVEAFLPPLPEGQPQGPQQPPPDPTALALIEAEKIKASATMEKAKMDNATKLQIEQQRAANDREVAMFKATQEIQLQREKMMWEQSVAIQQPTGA